MENFLTTFKAQNLQILVSSKIQEVKDIKRRDSFCARKSKKNINEFLFTLAYKFNLRFELNKEIYCFHGYRVLTLT